MANCSPIQASPSTETSESMRSLSVVTGVKNESDMLSSRRNSLGSHCFSSCSYGDMTNISLHEIDGSEIESESPHSPNSCYSSVASNALAIIRVDGVVPLSVSEISTEENCTCAEQDSSRCIWDPEQRCTNDIVVHKNVSQEVDTNDDIYEKLERFVAEAETSQRELFVESMKRKKAEKEVIDVMRRVKEYETMYTKELKRRKEIEEALDELTEELRVAIEQKNTTERQILESDENVYELEHKFFSAVDLLQKYKKKIDELEVERDDAVRKAEELREKQNEEASSSSVSQFFLEFSLSEIDEGTGNFNQAFKIGEGGYGSVYKGYLRHTQVAIKKLCHNSSQGPLEFLQEVNTLSKLRHPNIVTLIGACPEASALIYEYLSNGSLEDRLDCKDNTIPLPWQIRISIASEVCSALVFLHSCHPQGIVHGDLKPSNVLLDANFVTKLSDFGICRLLPQNSGSNTTLTCITNPKGTILYIDPIFLATGELTSKSDVYSFGILLLRLLTGRPAMGIAQEVRCALDEGNLNNLLDPTAGEWPFVQARQLAHLAISCSDLDRKNRPDLASEVWRVLESMRVSCGVFSSFRFGSDVSHRVPAYFVCPIFQEIMQNPVVAADGYTYETEAIKGWLDTGHETSPMTNIKLPHTNLVSNHALRSAIQEWQHQHY